MRKLHLGLLGAVTTTLALGWIASCAKSGREFRCPAALIPSSMAIARSPSAAQLTEKPKRVIVVVLENGDIEEARKQTYFNKLALQGATLTNYHGLRRPSQPNYIALISGDVHDVDSNGDFRLEERHLGTLLEEKGKTWKNYAESYPGNCFLGATSGPYVRKHVPFLSFADVQDDPARCARVAPSSEFDSDAAAGTLPDFSLFIPNNDSNGHDTGVEHAATWFEQAFGAKLADAAFMSETLFILTFDEGKIGEETNRVYTLMLGAGVTPGATSDACYTHYDMLKTFQDVLGLDTLGENDEDSLGIREIWKN